jgi:hypothetical protein
MVRQVVAVVVFIKDLCQHASDEIEKPHTLFAADSTEDSEYV